MNTALCSYVLRLYQGSRECSATHFTDWALEQSRELVHFDSALWATGFAGVSINSVHLYNLPPEIIQEWEAYRKNDSLLNSLVEGISEHTINLCNITRAKKDGAASSKICKTHCDKFGIRHALCTSTQDRTTRIQNYICFYRAPGNKAFTEKERKLKDFLTPHLVEARNINLIAYFNLYKEGPYLSAVCDRFGMLHQSEQGFIDLLRLEWPGIKLPYLPVDIVDHVTRKSNYVHEGKHIALKSAPLGDLIHVQARKESRMTELSSRERMITKHLVSGHTYKQIASTLNISPSTVTKHVNSIYKKTGAKNKTQLAKLIGMKNTAAEKTS
jgi:DNA-binding CsgD family transcriptional regulator